MDPVGCVPGIVVFPVPYLRLSKVNSEDAGISMFVAKNGEILTPRDNMRGITRQAVIDLAHEAGHTVTETRVETFDIYNVDEAFLSSTAGGIIPIAALDGRTVAAGRRGPITRTSPMPTTHRCRAAVRAPRSRGENAVPCMTGTIDAG